MILDLAKAGGFIMAMGDIKSAGRTCGQSGIAAASEKAKAILSNAESEKGVAL